jgi:hypothetical protein
VKRTVWKYAINSPEVHTISAEGDPTVVHVGLDGTDTMCVWIDHIVPAEPTIVKLAVVGTGWAVPDVGWHVGSCVDRGGFVWHVYQVES